MESSYISGKLDLHWTRPAVDQVHSGELSLRHKRKSEDHGVTWVDEVDHLCMGHGFHSSVSRG